MRAKPGYISPLAEPPATKMVFLSATATTPCATRQWRRLGKKPAQLSDSGLYSSTCLDWTPPRV